MERPKEMIEVEYVRRAFGDNPRAMEFFLREFAAPGEFDRIYAEQVAKELRKPVERLTRYEEKLLLRAKRRLADRTRRQLLQDKHNDVYRH